VTSGRLRRALRIAAWVSVLSLITFVLSYAFGIWAYVGGILAGPTVNYSGYDGPVLVSADGRTITVGGESIDAICGGPTIALDAEQDATQVALRLRSTTAPPGLLRPGVGGSTACSAPRLLYLDVELNHPLGTRTLVNGGTGRVLPYFDGRMTLRPRWLPAGYTLWYVSPYLPDPSGEKPAPVPVACGQWFQSSSGGLVIKQLMGEYDFPGSSPIQVRGHAGAREFELDHVVRERPDIGH
jgi:hypothetical protein